MTDPADFDQARFNKMVEGIESLGYAVNYDIKISKSSSGYKEYPRIHFELVQMPPRVKPR